VKIFKAGASPFLQGFADFLLELSRHSGAVDSEFQGASQMQTNESEFNEAVDANKHREDSSPINQVQKQVVPTVTILLCHRCGFPNPEMFCPRCGHRQCVACGDGP
jgi:rubrerythrin